jgi:hypothetical protein
MPSGRLSICCAQRPKRALSVRYHAWVDDVRLSMRFVQRSSDEYETCARYEKVFNSDLAFRKELRKTARSVLPEERVPTPVLERPGYLISFPDDVIYYEVLGFGFETSWNGESLSYLDAEIQGLNEQGELVWDTTSINGSQTLTIGDLVRAHLAGFLDEDPTRLIVEVGRKSSISMVGSSACVTLPPDAWQDLVALAAFLVAVSQIDDLLVKYGDLIRRIASSCLRIGAMRDAQKLCREAPPQRLVRFVRRRADWQSAKLARLLRLEVTDAEALLAFSGYQEDKKDGLWKPRLDPSSDAMYDLATCLLYLIDDQSHQHITGPFGTSSFAAFKSGDMSAFLEAERARKQRIREVFAEVSGRGQDAHGSEIALIGKLIDELDIAEPSRIRLEASIMALLADIQHPSGERNLPYSRSTEELVNEIERMKYLGEIIRRIEETHSGDDEPGGPGLAQLLRNQGHLAPTVGLLLR